MNPKGPAGEAAKMLRAGVQRWWLRSTALTVVLVVALASVTPWTVIAQTNPEPDNDDDPYDQFTCQGISEDEVEDTREGAVTNPGGPIDLPGSSSRNGGNDPDAFSPFPNGSFQLPFDLSFGGGQQGGQSGGGGTSLPGGGTSGGGIFSFVPTYTNEEDQLANQSAFPEPAVSIQLTQPTAVEGEEVTTVVQYDSFISNQAQGQDFYTVAFVDGIFLNGYLAGGDPEALEQQRNSPADPARPDCGVYSRATTVDSDNDGMDDAWELRYGLDPTNPADAGQDLDADGYAATAYPNLEGDFVQPAPAVANAVLGDGIFTNYEEYLLGTDPTNPDTDGDGYPDEADAVGLGQTVVDFPATKVLGEGAYQLRVIVVGLTGKHNEDHEQLVKIDSATREIPIGTREDLGVELLLVSSAAPGETVIVEAEPSGTKQHDLLNTYRWSVNGELQTALSGQGRRTLELPLEDSILVGTELDITLDVINFETGQLAKGALTVVVGDNILLDFDPQEVESRADVAVRALLTSTDPSGNFLFNWSLDGQLDPRASRIGAQEFVVPVTARAGSSHAVQVDVYRTSDSALLGSASATLQVLQPVVVLSVLPEQPQAGEQTVAQADVDHFGAETLAYQFTVDQTVLETSGPIVTLPTLSQGRHVVGVTVNSIDTPRETASDQLEVNVLPAALLSSSSGSSTLSASLLSTPALGAGSAVVVGAGALMLLRFTRSRMVTS